MVIAGPAISAAVSARLTAITTGYVLTTAVLGPLGARLGDRRGRVPAREAG